jgi:hypothetical protein
MRRALPVLALFAGTLAGCSGLVQTVAYPFPRSGDAARSYLQDAGRDGPVLLEVRGNPFAADAAVPFAAAATGGVNGISVAFTADRAAARAPDYRIVVQFDPAESATVEQVCDAARPVAQRRAEGPLSALVAFCHRGDPVLYLTATAPRPDSPAAPVMRELAQQAMARMFMPDDTDRGQDWWPD